MAWLAIHLSKVARLANVLGEVDHQVQQLFEVAARYLGMVGDKNRNLNSWIKFVTRGYEQSGHLKYLVKLAEAEVLGAGQAAVVGEGLHLDQPVDYRLQHVLLD